MPEKIEVFNIDNVAEGMRVSQDIKDKNGLLLIGANMQLTYKLIEKLRQYGISKVPIYVSSQNMSDLISDVDVNETFRHQLLNNVGIIVEKHIKDTSAQQRILEIIADFVKDDILLSLLIEIKTIGHNVFQHTLNVFALSMLMGLKNHFPVDRLIVLAEASLLHDIGKKFLPKEIFDNFRNLDEEGKKTYEQHPLFGYEYLHSLGKFPNEVERIILQHHEKLDGSGYPNKLKGQDIHKMAQIIAIADDFDSIIAGQELQNRFIYAEAIEYLQGSGGIYFNYDLVTCLLEEISVYRLHDWVVLSNDDIGLITKLNQASQLRPIVTVFFDKFHQKYTCPKIIDLTSKSHMSLFIKDIL